VVRWRPCLDHVPAPTGHDRARGRATTVVRWVWRVLRWAWQRPHAYRSSPRVVAVALAARWVGALQCRERAGLPQLRGVRGACAGRGRVTTDDTSCTSNTQQHGAPPGAPRGRAALCLSALPATLTTHGQASATPTLSGTSTLAPPRIHGYTSDTSHPLRRGEA